MYFVGASKFWFVRFTARALNKASFNNFIDDIQFESWLCGSMCICVIIELPSPLVLVFLSLNTQVYITSIGSMCICVIRCVVSSNKFQLKVYIVIRLFWFLSCCWIFIKKHVDSCMGELFEKTKTWNWNLWVNCAYTASAYQLHY